MLVRACLNLRLWFSDSFPCLAWDLVLGLFCFWGARFSVHSVWSLSLGTGSRLAGCGWDTFIVGMLHLLYSVLLFRALPTARMILTASVSCLLRLVWCFFETLKLKILDTSVLEPRVPASSGWYSCRCLCIWLSSLFFRRSQRCSVDLL